MQLQCRGLLSGHETVALLRKTVLRLVLVFFSAPAPKAFTRIEVNGDTLTAHDSSGTAGGSASTPRRAVNHPSGSCLVKMLRRRVFRQGTELRRAPGKGGEGFAPHGLVDSPWQPNGGERCRHRFADFSNPTFFRLRAAAAILLLFVPPEPF